MQMIKMDRERFLSYVLDQRKELFSDVFEVYYLNPSDARGDHSSFVIVTVINRMTGAVYSGVSKFNPADKSDPRARTSEFTLEEGLKQACNRAWREMHNMPSLYGRNNSGASKPKTGLIPPGVMAVMISRLSSLSRIRPESTVLRSARRRLISAISEEGDAATKPAHS